VRAAPLAVLLAACTSGRVHDRLNVRVDGAVLPVEVHGNIGSGTLLVVESGGPSGPSIAQRAVGHMPFRDTLEPALAVAMYDRRGTGNATGDYSPEDQSMGLLLSDLDAVLTVLRARYEPERVVLMGHSFGTYTSGRYTIEHPGEIDGWVATAPAFIDGPDELYIVYRRDFACRVAADQLAGGSTDALWTDLEVFCAENPVVAPIWDTPEREALWSYLDQIAERLEPWPAMRVAGLMGAVFASHYSLIDAQLRPNLISRTIVAEPGREDLLPEVGGLDLPVAVITGEFDGTTPTEMGTALRSAIGPQASLTEVPGGGHYMMADAPDAFADVVLGLVDGLTPR
jgi:pimeloyl-ACP methyl ester carboxylesterase